MGKHRPSIVWGLRSKKASVEEPNISEGYVSTENDEFISVRYRWRVGHGWQSISLPRADARLLAKRINQCLDETRG